MDMTPSGVTGGTVFGTVLGAGLAQAVGTATEPAGNLLLIAIVAGAFTAGGGIVTTLITAHFAGKTALAVAEATAHAAVAAKIAQLAVDKTDEVAKQTIVMSGLLDGKLEELIRLSRAEAEAVGVEKERARGEAKAEEVAAQAKADAQAVRTEAREDRQEVRDAGGSSTVVSGKTEDPVHMIIANSDPVPVRETPDKDKPDEPA